MSRLTASDLIKAIDKLPKDRDYNYPEPATTTKLIIEEVRKPEGPIIIRRYDPNNEQTRKDAKRASISSNLIWRVANAIRPDIPVNLDRALGGSYNVRSALEALLVHTPQFYYCYPGRIEVTTSSTKIQEGHKHMMWRPNAPHKQGVMEEATVGTDMAISEMPITEVVYEALVVPEREPEPGMTIEMSRRHAQIQIALVEIGRQLGFRTWVANNDKGIKYKGKKLGEMDGVIVSLRDEQLMAAFDDAARAALLIDCIWFRNAKFMPAVIEIEQSTGVVRGLARMKKLQDAAPSIMTRFVIAAPDEDRSKVLKESNELQFRSLKPQFFPYSAIEELYSLCQRRKLRGVNDEFLDCFMEPCLPALQADN